MCKNCSSGGSKASSAPAASRSPGANYYGLGNEAASDETQYDIFGKKGISWHVSTAITRTSSDENLNSVSSFDVHTYVHILQLGSQGWFSVAHILKDVLEQIHIRFPHISQVFLKSDNASCFHCTPLLSFIQKLNSSSEIKILEYNFSEAQSGKDICDAKTAHCKLHILR